jgi:glycosyltransferase involved in cell wall biosynthesis
MKIAVLNNCVPFVSGGAEHLADALCRKLIEFGHQATLIRIPFRWEPPNRIVECMLACRLLRVPNVDRVIALKFPAYYVPHDDKVLWLLHQFRQAYDLWGTPYQGLPNTSDGLRVRNTILQADNAHLSQANRIYTNSAVTSGRLMRFNGIPSTVLHPPLMEPDQFRCGDYGDYVFLPGRITASKRQHLVVESMRHVSTRVKLIVAGKEEAEEDIQRIRSSIRDFGLSDRVTLINRFISEQEKVELMAGALCCAYIPYDEDSYGYVALESYLSRKPVVTCTDSGGTDLLVKDGITGCLVPPEARAIAKALDSLYSDRQRARKMGEEGRRLVQQLDISWERVIHALTQ